MLLKIKKFLLIIFTMVVFVVLNGFLNTSEAALQPYIFFGVVENTNIKEETIAIKNIQWATASQSKITSVVGKPPNNEALHNLSSDQNVIVYSLGTPENFVTIAKFKSNIKQYLTDIYGEIEFAENFSKLTQEFRSKCPFPFPSGHFISYNNTPDCDSCAGAICQATNTSVVLEKSDADNIEYDLRPGEQNTFQINDYQIYVKFIEGEVSSSKCGQMAVGPQPTSNFVVRVTPQINPAKGNMYWTDDGQNYL